MKKGLTSFLSLYLLLGILIFIFPSNILYAQDDDTVEDIFWGDEDEDEGLDEEFDFSEDDEDLEGLEFEDESLLMMNSMMNSMMNLSMMKIWTILKRISLKKRKIFLRQQVA